MILGITGKRLSGKSTAAGYLEGRYGFHSLGFTEDLLSLILIKRKEPVNRINLINLGMELRKKHKSRSALARLIAEKILPGNDYAVSGIRLPEEVTYLRKRFGRDFILIAVRASAEVRYSRAVANKRFKEIALDRKGFMKIDCLPTERIIPKAMKMADFHVNGGRTKGELQRDVDRIMQKLKISVSL